MSEVSRGIEVWLPVVGYEGSYEVSDHGRVRSVDRVVSHPFRGGTRTRRYAGILRKLSVSDPRQGGYLTVQLVNSEGRRATRAVHRFVLEAFAGPCPPGKEALHADDDRMNNRISNLRWGTHLENMGDRNRNSGHPMSKRVRCPWEHLLVAPNLCQVTLRTTGKRNCLTCKRVRAFAIGRKKRTGEVVDLVARRRFTYTEIMGDFEDEANMSPHLMDLHAIK